MKKKILLSMMVLLASAKTYSQIPFYDAINIYNDCTDNSTGQFKTDPNSVKSLSAYLRNYLPSTVRDCTLTEDQVLSQFASNPFLGPQIQTLRSGGMNADLAGFFSNIPASVGGINVTNFADGVAKFLVERFKQELTLAFFDKLKKQMNDERYSDLKVLFPETWKTLMTIDKDIYQYSIYLNTLREAFRKDMTNEFVNLEALLKQQKYQEFFNDNNPELGTILRTSLYLINGFSSGKHPGDVLADFNPAAQIVLSTPNVNLQTNIRSSISTIQLISKSLRSQSNTNYWVPADSVRLLFDEDLIAFKIYLGLIYQQASGNKYDFIISGSSRSLRQMLTDLASVEDSILEYKYFIETFIDNAQEINENIVSIKSKKKSEIDYNDYYKLFNSSLDLVEQSSSFIELPYVNLYLNADQRNNIKTNTGKLLFVARTAGDLYVDVRTKNYSSAIANSIALLDTLLDYNATYKLSELKSGLNSIKKNLKENIKTDSLSKVQKKNVNALIKSYSANSSKDIEDLDRESSISGISQLIKDLMAEIIEGNREVDDLKNKSKLKNLILKYGSFIAAVAQAENSDEVKNAIESAVLPAGSYSIKQKSAWNASFNGYMGYNWDFKGGTKKENLYAKGIYAPLGISISKGLSKKYGGAITVFASIIDVGAVASYRLMTSMTDTLKQEVRLESIFSPGVQFFLSVPKTPLAFGIGWRSTPKLFYSGNSEFLPVPSRDVFTISVLVDIPFFNIYNRPYKN